MRGQVRRGGEVEPRVCRSGSTRAHTQYLHATTAVRPERRSEREKQPTDVDPPLLPSGEWNRPSHAGKAGQRSTVGFVAVLSSVLITGGLAGLLVWMTLNDALEGRASVGQIWLGLVALIGLLALLCWFKRFLERWQDTV
jgi:hypothetical protein